MAGSLIVENLDDGIMLRLKQRTARHGHSQEAEAGDILRLVLEAKPVGDFEVLAAELRRVTSDRKHTPSEILLQEDRNER